MPAIALIPKSLTRNGWRASHLAWGLGLAVAGLLLTWGAWADLIGIARKDEEASHALLVPLIVVWLIWVRRGRLRHCRPVGLWIGPVITLLGAGLYLLGEARLIESFWHGGAIMVVAGCCLTVMGRQVLRDFLPVFLVLAFLVPVPGRVRQRMAIPLQRTTARLTQEVCDIAGIAIDRSGNVLRINGVDVAVAEACNGMRMTFALMLVSFAFAFTTPLNGYVRVLVILLSPLSAVLCNVIRLVPTVWVFGNFHERIAAQFHVLSGWVMLFVGFLLLMLVIRLLRWFAVPVSPFSLAHN